MKEEKKIKEMKIYPETIKSIRKGNIELFHNINLNEFGTEQDYFELVIYNDDGSKSTMPLMPPIVVSNYSTKDPIKFTNEYSDKDYEYMFEENVGKFVQTSKD